MKKKLWSKKKKDKKEDEENDSLPYWKLYRYATAFDKFLIFLGTICIIITGMCSPYMLVLFSLITGNIVDYVSATYENLNGTIPNATLDKMGEELATKVYDFAISTTVLGFATIIFSYISGILFSYSALRQIFVVRKKFFERSLHQDIEWFDKNRSGDFATSFTDNLNKIEEGIGDKVSMFLFYQTVFVVGVVWALILGWKLALVCLISLPLSTIIMGTISWISTKFSKQEMESYSAAGTIAEEVLGCVRTVVAFDGQDSEIKRYGVHLIEARTNNIRKSFFNGISNGFLWFFIYSCYALSFWYGVGLILEEKYLPESEKVYTPGNMIAVFFNTLMAGWNFGMAAPFFQTFGVACGAAAKIFKILDSEPKISIENKSGKKPATIQGDIHFDNVYFNYPSRPDVEILTGLELKIKSGETVALVGSSGCGKSTCIQLIQRFYDADAGNLFIDGTNIKDLNLGCLRSKIGVVGQEPALFSTTISDNIRYGKLSATQDEVEKAAKKAQVHQFIKSLPQGYDTLVGERGAQLSGGQKQRIAIARALIRQPSILLLDEATSALDTTSEAEVQAALDNISTECTTIIVAHRLSTIKNANRIIVIDKGKVIEQGSHSQLIQAKGAYYNLVKHHNSDEDEKNKRNSVLSLQKQNGVTYARKDSIMEVHKYQHRKSETVPPEKQRAGTLFKVLRMNRPEWLAIFIGCVASVLSGAGSPVYSLIFGDIVGILADPNDEFVRNQSNLFSLYFLILGIVTGIAFLVQTFAFGYAGEHLTMRVREKMFSTMLKQEMAWFDREENGVGALCAKLSGDAANIQGASGMPIGTALTSLSTLLLSNAFALYFEWRLALVLNCFAPVIFVSIWAEQGVLQGDTEENQKILESSAKIAVEALSNIRTVKSLGAEIVFYQNYIEELNPYQRIQKRKAHYRSIVLALAKSLIFFAYAVGLSYGTKLILENKIPYADIFKVCECVIVGSWCIGQAFAFSPNFQKGLNSATRMFKLFERVPRIRNVTYASSNPWEEGNIEYSRVYFSYPTRSTTPVLRGLDLSILKDKTVALVGSSGSGKSTIVQLLERFYTPTSGEVCVDDTDIKVMDMKFLRSHFGIVSQEPNLFDRTIAENIAYGATYREVTQEEIIEAAKKANIHNFITSLPLGYETRLGTRGTQLSGGQKQRVAIARALIRNPKILLLDEATSALDNESEKVVQEALDNAKKGRTCITIAHRLTTIQDADVICVLKDGRVVEMGTHNELLDRRGHYYEFYKLQSSH